jgi:hypothetical protein
MPDLELYHQDPHPGSAVPHQRIQGLRSLGSPHFLKHRGPALASTNHQSNQPASEVRIRVPPSDNS